MTAIPWLPYTATPDEYERQAATLLAAVEAGDESAQWRFKWEHPRFHGKSLADVRAAGLGLDDARLAVAREYAFDSWSDLTAFAHTVATGGRVARFEAAVEAVVVGDLETLRAMLQETPDLVHERSSRRHHATLLHYVAANGVEDARQKTPPNAVAIARLLLDRGAAADALARMYDADCTTMSMLVSSAHPAEAGLQSALAETLLDHGAALEGPGSKWQSALLTALAFGYLDTAKTLARRGAPVNDLASAAGLGRLDDATRLLPGADPAVRHIALALAAQHGHTEVVRLLLDAGEPSDRYNPDGFHSHTTPLHQAVWSNHLEVVRLLVDRGAPLDIQDTLYRATPLDWAIHGARTEIATYLRDHGAPTSQLS